MVLKDLIVYTNDPIRHVHRVVFSLVLCPVGGYGGGHECHNDPTLCWNGFPSLVSFRSGSGWSQGCPGLPLNNINPSCGGRGGFGDICSSESRWALTGGDCGGFCGGLSGGDGGAGICSLLSGGGERCRTPGGNQRGGCSSGASGG